MKIKYGLISCDSHGQLDRNAFTSRMSAAKWGDRIPRVVEAEVDGQRFDVWTARSGSPARGFSSGVVNCPAVMPNRKYPTRWEDVPPKVYDPAQRLTALDEDGVDGEVLFPNTPVGLSFASDYDTEYELACVEAYNDALGSWTQVSDRYIPLALIPYLNPIEDVIHQVELAAQKGHRGITIPAEPSRNVKGAKALNDPFWEPLWATCQDLGLVINWHGSAGLMLAVPYWEGYSHRQAHTVSTGRLAATCTQQLPSLMFSGILDRYPRLKWAFAETGSGWFCYVLDACDHEWEQRHLWTEGILTRPSEAFRRQVYVDFWFERSGIELRHYLGIDHLMWESDYPHITSTYPNSRTRVEQALEGVPAEERPKLMYQNVLNLYGLEEEEA